MTPAVRRPQENVETSRFPCRRRLHVPGSQTAQGRTGSRAYDPARVAFCGFERIGTPDDGIYAAQWLAHTLPCQRFTDRLAAASA